MRSALDNGIGFYLLAPLHRSKEDNNVKYGSKGFPKESIMMN
jgi:hypothetical protein